MIIFRLRIDNKQRGKSSVDQKIVCIFMQITFILHTGSILTEEFSSDMYIRTGLYRDTKLEMARNSNSNWISLVLNALRFVASTFDRSLNSPQRKYIKCAASRNLNCGRGLLLKYIVITFIGEIKRIFEWGYFYF